MSQVYQLVKASHGKWHILVNPFWNGYDPKLLSDPDRLQWVKDRAEAGLYHDGVSQQFFDSLVCWNHCDVVEEREVTPAELPAVLAKEGAMFCQVCRSAAEKRYDPTLAGRKARTISRRQAENNRRALLVVNPDLRSYRRTEVTHGAE